MNWLFGGNKFPVDGRTVVITGGSLGMGRGLAKLLSSKGANIVIVARGEKKLIETLAEVKAASKSPESQRHHYISANVTIAEENIRIVEEVKAWNNGCLPDIVWANAGGSQPQLFLDTPIETFKSQMDLNFFAALYLAHATLSAWLAPGDTKSQEEKRPPARHFIMTSTSASFVGLAGYAPYSTPKWALKGLHDNLTSELHLYNDHSSHPTTPNVEVHTVFPGTILTDGLVNESKTKHPVTKILEEGDPEQTEDEVAKVAVAELEKGRHLITTQILAAAMRAGGLQGSVRDRWFVDTIFSWIVAIVWLFVTPDLNGKVKKWARENGRPVHQKEM